MLLFSLLSHTPWCCYTIIFLFLFLLFMHCNYSWVTSKYVVFITNKGTMNICVHIFVWGLKFPFFWNKFSNMWFLDHMVTTLSVERNCQNSFPSDRAILHPCHNIWEDTQMTISIIGSPFLEFYTLCQMGEAKTNDIIWCCSQYM